MVSVRRVRLNGVLVDEVSTVAHQSGATCVAFIVKIKHKSAILEGSSAARVIEVQVFRIKTRFKELAAG